jgi:hypothetical protein
LIGLGVVLLWFRFRRGLLMSVERSRPYPGSSHASSKRSVGIVVALFISCRGIGYSGSGRRNILSRLWTGPPKLCVPIIWSPQMVRCSSLGKYTKILGSVLAPDTSIRLRRRHLTPPPLVRHFPNVRVGSGRKYFRTDGAK